MGKVVSYTKTGNKSQTQATLPKEIFEVEVKNNDLLHRAYKAYLGQKRQVGAKTKTRGEVRGGGRKPHIQKGTGRARAGSIRQPNWVGGGVVFGPTGQENYVTKLSKKAKKLAIKQALSLKHKAEAVALIEDFDVNGKTKEASEILNKIGANRKVLIAVENKNDALVRATRNIPGVETVQATYLNVFNVLNTDLLLLTNGGLKQVKDWLAPRQAQGKGGKDE
ncbi:MAG: 50S ribosomal protein L4 [Candidatus Saccharimonadales bacterium]